MRGHDLALTVCSLPAAVRSHRMVSLHRSADRTTTPTFRVPTSPHLLLRLLASRLTPLYLGGGHRRRYKILSFLLAAAPWSMRSPLPSLHHIKHRLFFCSSPFSPLSLPSPDKYGRWRRSLAGARRSRIHHGGVDQRRWRRALAGVGVGRKISIWDLT